jgi:hypothetical protein
LTPQKPNDAEIDLKPPDFALFMEIPPSERFLAAKARCCTFQAKKLKKDCNT